MKGDSADPEIGEQTDTVSRRRSFGVLYVDDDSDSRKLVRETLEPTYPLSTAESLSSVDDAIDRETDCIVVAADLSTDAGSEFLDYVQTAGNERPVIVFGPTPDVGVLETLLSIPHSDLVSRADGQPTHHEIEALRSCLDDHYERSSSDIRETVLEIARSLMSAAPDEIDIEIEWALKLIGRRLDADRCLVFEYDGDTLERTHAWASQRKQLPPHEKVTADQFPGFETSIQSFDPHAIPSESSTNLDIDLPEGFVGSIQSAGDDRKTSASHPYLTERDLKSLLAVPIVIDWELEGILAIGQHSRRPWPHSLQQQVKTLGELIGHTIDRERRRQELAEQNDRLERFTSVVSHDLRNPLSVLTGYAELAAETGDLSYLDEVLESAERMETMIQDLLMLARKGTAVSDLRPVSLETVVDDAWNGVDTGDATIEIRDLEVVVCDPSRLQQAIENLFRNAVEHADPMERILVEGTDDGFAVEDDGPGIPPDKREVVFQEGYTGGGGTGLGLSIVHTIADAHGWSINLESGSELGGARFEFTVTDEQDD